MKKIFIALLIMQLFCSACAGEFEMVTLPSQEVLAEELSKINPAFVEVTKIDSKLAEQQMAVLGVDLAYDTLSSAYFNELINRKTPLAQVKKISEEVRQQKRLFLSVLFREHPASLQKLIDKEAPRSNL